MKDGGARAGVDEPRPYGIEQGRTLCAPAVAWLVPTPAGQGESRVAVGQVRAWTHLRRGFGGQASPAPTGCG